MQNYPIDFVIPWVDGSDPVWRAERSKYTANKNSDNSEARYREWGTLRYWFRAVEKYAPWVRTIHFVTCGHLPEWLDTDNPKLHVVKHSDYIPAEYLPTFSSHTIELNIHRIPGLAEHFVYFNDDFFVTAKSKPEDFFRDGKPVKTAVLSVVHNSDTANFMPYIQMNMLAIINMSFPKREMLKRNLSKWFSPCNGKWVLHNLYLLPWAAHTGFRNFHSANPFCKSTFEEVWEKWGEILDRTCRNRFRSREDVNQYLFEYWQLCQGNFVPHKPNSIYLTMGQDTAEEIGRELCSHRHKVVCINDDPLDFDFESERRILLSAFDEILPEKSSFELKR